MKKSIFMRFLVGILTVTLGFNVLTVSSKAQTIIPISEITGIATTINATNMSSPMVLNGIIAPVDATNKTIIWSVKNGGATGATITDNQLLVPVSGNIIVTATVVNGITEGVNYVQDFPITVGYNDTQKVVLVKGTVEDALNTYTVNNQTTKDDISKIANDIIADLGFNDVSLNWQTAQDFNKILATASTTGSISGQLNFICNLTNVSLTLNKTINKLVPIATSSIQKIEGFIDEELAPYTFTITLEEDTIKEALDIDSPLATSIVKNTPAGVNVKFKQAVKKGDTTIELEVSGTPIELFDEVLILSIPKGMLESNLELNVQSNANLKWGIKRNTVKQLQAAKDTLNSKLGTIQVNNTTTKEDILKEVNSILGYHQFTSVVTSWKSFDLEHATISKDGQVVGEINLKIDDKDVNVQFNKTITKLISYPIKDGENSTWIPKENEIFEIRIDGEFSKFIGLMINGKYIDPKLYTVREGSTIISFKPEILKVLGSGEFEVAVDFTDGRAITKFTLKEEVIDSSIDTGAVGVDVIKEGNIKREGNVNNAKSNGVKTGVQSEDELYFALLVLSIASFIVIVIKKRRTLN